MVINAYNRKNICMKKFAHFTVNNASNKTSKSLEYRDYLHTTTR